MAANSKIEWTEQTWNPIVGCSIVSPGCTNCYAMKMAARCEAMGISRYEGTTKSVNGNTAWTGKINKAPNATWLAPLDRKKRTTYFVNSMGDLFHEDCPDDWILDALTVMAAAHQHTFQVLTKRAARMREFMSRPRLLEEIYLNWYAWTGGAREVHGWPLPNVWLGVSTERQKEADERIPHLLQTPAAVRFISAEPLLGHISLHALNLATDRPSNALRGVQCIPDDSDEGYHNETGPGLDWVIVGGESGPDARPTHPDWARSLRDQCAAADVPFFFKQWGEWLPGEANRGQFDARPMHAYRRCDNHGYEWPRRGEVRNFGSHPDKFSGDFHARRIGKKAAGRMLDGAIHDGVPQHRQSAIT